MGLRVCLIALGCEKNTVNSEQMLWLLDQAGFRTVSSPSEADVTVINTCGFIERAKQEAIENILEAAAFPGKIVVAGCLAERYREEIFDQLPEVSALVGCGRFDDIEQAVRAAHDGRRTALFGPLGDPVSQTPRLRTGPGHTAFLKIAEGCSNRCSYCAIPSIRGPYRSRPMGSVLEEARGLVRSGARELILIAQDTARYGTDLTGGQSLLPALLTELCGMDGPEWIRVMYLYPEGIGEDLIDVVAREEKICKYLDIPIQHVSDRILRDMNRRGSGDLLRRLVAELRRRIPGVVLRTSLIAGFPGESEEEFAELCEFLRDSGIERAGVFPYSAEEGTPAALLPGQVDQALRLRRAERLQAIASDNMDRWNAARKGGTMRVLCEGYDRLAGVYFGRSEADAPEVDGKIFFRSRRKVAEGQMVSVLITGALDGDLTGRIP